VRAAEERRDVTGADERQQELRWLRVGVRLLAGRVRDRPVGVAVRTEQGSGAVVEVLLAGLHDAGEARHRDGGLDALVADARALAEAVGGDAAERVSRRADALRVDPSELLSLLVELDHLADDERRVGGLVLRVADGAPEVGSARGGRG